MGFRSLVISTLAAFSMGACATRGEQAPEDDRGTFKQDPVTGCTYISRKSDTPDTPHICLSAPEFPMYDKK